MLINQLKKINYIKKKTYRSLFLLTFAFFAWSTFTYSQELLETDEIEFRFTDRQSFDESQLKDAIALTKSNVFSLKLVEGDIQKLKKFYFDNGFFDVTVDTLITVNREDSEASVIFEITENSRYKIDSVLTNGFEKIPSETLGKFRRINTIKKGDNYSKVLIIQYGNEILDTLQNNGFMNARYRMDSGTVIRRYKEKSTAVVELSFEGTDTIYYFGTTKINIKDNEYGVRTELPAEEITYKEGEIFSKAKKLESERNISKIPIISSAKLNPVEYSGNTVNFTADITLNKKNELTPFIKGSNFENRFYLGAGIRYLNKYFLSGNRTLMLELEGDFNSPDINRSELSATVTQPHFIRRNITLTDKLAIGFNNVENYKNYFLANFTTLNYFIAPHTFYNNVYLDLNEELIWIKYDTIATGRQTQFNSILSITFEHDNTNNLLAPSRGFYHSILAGNAGLLPRLVTGLLGKSVFYSQFFKVYTLNKGYFSLGRKDHTVLAANIKIGDIIEYGAGENIIPVQPPYKFFSGGSSSLRGWNAKGNGMLENKINGGTFLLEGSIELRRKLFPDAEGFTSALGGAVFFDYGNVWETHKNFRVSQIAMAVGVGVRYDLFIGLIRFDFGFKLYDPSAPEGEQWLFDNPGRIFIDKFAVQFGIGQAF
ncbi:MAG TPA: BamA/TamA family outer membrane protein [Ignavibacteria bacterium]|nr:BamA/TamA family outer membrane protein [Ignavibacteria bacterium]